MLASLTMLFGGLALLLAMVGLYGITAYTVERRTSEIGIRMALGAERSRVVSMVLRGAMGQTLLGLAIGVPVALLSVRFVKSQSVNCSFPGPSDDGRSGEIRWPRTGRRADRTARSGLEKQLRRRQRCGDDHERTGRRMDGGTGQVGQ